MDTHEQQLPEYTDKPSKTQRKREALALQKLGETLVTLKPTQLAQIPMPDELREAVLAAQSMPQRGAHKRQLQYIGRLMREIDPEPIRAALTRWRPGG
ncbi:MAG: ribosome biogenesis factor YjgA [Candidatus Competibacteraceae bacterium]